MPNGCRALSYALFFLLPVLAAAQSVITVAGYGYRIPSNVIVAAPGQLMSVSVFGIPPGIQPAFLVAGTNGFPFVVQDLSVTFVQGPLSIRLPIRGVQQTDCPAFGTCLPATIFTVQIPYELDLAGPAAELEVRSGANVASRVSIHGVTDAIHILNTCDQIAVYLSVAFAVPQGVCVPIVTHASGVLISVAAPAKPGETLVMWAYGLGAVDHPIAPGCCSDPGQLPLTLQPFQLSVFYSVANSAPLRKFAQPAFTYSGMVGAGLYQLHFQVPNAPADLPSCAAGKANLHLLASGPNSSDVADVCLAP